MRIHWGDVTENDTNLDFTEKDKWILSAVCAADELYEGQKSILKVREAACSMRLHKVDEVVEIQGKLKTSIQLLCSRCGEAFAFALQPKFQVLLTRDAVMAGIPEKAGRVSGHAKPVHEEEDEDDEIEITFLREDTIDLADVVSEQIQLRIPFQPLCKAECKGVCTQCGTNLNQGRCVCNKIIKNKPLSLLGKLKLKS